MICPFAGCGNADNCPNLAECRVTHRQVQGRESRALNASRRQTARDNQQVHIGQYMGYDCTTGEDVVKLADGGIVRGEPISNGQATGPVAIHLPFGSANGISDRMPR